MKSKKLIILSLIISIFTIKINDSNALLGFGAYTGLKLNYSIDNNKFNNNSGISFGVLGGIRLFDLRADLEYNMLGKAIDQSTQNVYWRWNWRDNFYKKFNIIKNRQ